MQYRVNSIQSLKRLAVEMGGLLRPGLVIFLEGPVGVGKSTFVRLCLAELKIQYAGSPTFGLLNKYTTHDLSIVHVDLYRDHAKIEEQLLEYYDAALLIEWASRSDTLYHLFPESITIKLEFDGLYRTCTMEF